MLSARVAQARRQEIEKFRRRSSAIRFWRRALPVVIVLVVGVLVVWIAGRSLLIKATAPKPPQATGLRMVNPRFFGRDSGNHAFVLGAAEAARDSSTGKGVSLQAPNLTMDAGGPQPTTVQAAQGVYREDERQLALKGQVQLKSGGYVFTTPNATVDTSKGAVYGKSGVTGQGPLGKVTAQTYGVYDRGHRVIMKGDVHAHIVQ
jgi:lipopolysaccharide export system protein LptC